MAVVIRKKPRSCPSLGHARGTRGTTVSIGKYRSMVFRAEPIRGYRCCFLSMVRVHRRSAPVMNDEILVHRKEMTFLDP